MRDFMRFGTLPMLAPDSGAGAGGAGAGAGDGGAGGALLTGDGAGAGGAAAGGDWLTGLDDDHKTWLAAKGQYKSPADVVKAYRATEKIIGADKVAVPGKDAKPEDWDPVWNKLGRPEKADGYKVTKPEGASWYDDGFATKAAAAAHKAGLTQAQYQAMHDFYIGDIGAGMTAAGAAEVARHAQGKATLTSKWGQTYGENLEFANRAVKFAPGLAAELQALKLESAPALAQALAVLGRFYSEEGKLIGGGQGGGAGFGGMTKEQALAEERKLNADADFTKAFLDRQHPGHEDAKARMARVQQAIHGSQT